MIASPEFILYVAEQQRSRDFYAAVLDLTPTIDVPGMTEFTIGSATLGLMPEAGIRNLLGSSGKFGSSPDGVSRCELYLTVSDPESYAHRAIQAGACELSPLLPRAWGHDVAYYSDPDGHVIAFARPSHTA